MPPTLSDADRFSGDDDDNNKSDNSSSFVHVPRSTHREMVSNNVKRVSRDVPGFSDWRGSSSRSKSRGRDDTKEEDAAVVVELNFATRRRLNRSSSPGVGGSEKCRKSRRPYQQVPSSKSTQSSRTAESISTSGKSDSSSMLSADHRYTEFGRPQRRRRERKERVANNNNNYNTKTETISPTSKKEEVSFHESETTMKFDNTKAATVIKYRAAYEEILESIETLERFERSMSNDRSGRSNDGSGRLSESSSLSQHGDKGVGVDDDRAERIIESGISSLTINNNNCNNVPQKDVKDALRSSLLRYVDEITAGITLHSDNDDKGGDDVIQQCVVINHEALVKKGVDDLLQSLILKTKEQAGTNTKENPSSMKEARSPSREHRDEQRRDFDESVRSRDARRSSTSTESRRRSSSRTSSSDIEDEHASVSSQRSSMSIGSHISNRSQRSSKSNRSNRSTSSGKKGKQYAADNVSTGKNQQLTNKKGGFFQRIKNLAGKVKTTLGVTGVHKFQLGESARYKTLKVKNKSWMIAEGTYDVETLTASVDIVAVHIDAVLEMPYYTVQLSDGSLKRTNWDKLMTLSDYKKLKSCAAASDKVDGKVDDHLVNCGSTRDASAGRLRNMARRFSSPFRERDVDTTGLSVNDEDTALSGSINSSQRQGQEEQDGKRRNHRNSSQRRNSSRRRSSSKRNYTEEDRSTSKASSRRSSRSGNKGTGGRPVSQIQGDSKSSRSRGGRPRSQSPFTRDRQCHTTINSQQPHSFHAASKPEFQAPVRNESSSVVEGRSSSPQSITTERISNNLEIATKPLTHKHSVVVVEDVTNNESMMW